MKAGERDRVGALRMISNALQQDAKEGKGDEVAVLRRERKRRLEAATAFREGGGDEGAKIVDGAGSEAGVSDPKEMGKVMGSVMPKVDWRADGKRVSAAV